MGAGSLAPFNLMPKFSELNKTQTISLPGIDGSELVIKKSFTVKETKEAEQYNDDIEKSLFLASKVILSWNFTNDDGKDMPINMDTLKDFPTEHLEYIFNLIIPQKKSSSEQTQS